MIYTGVRMLAYLMLRCVEVLSTRCLIISGVVKKHRRERVRNLRYSCLYNALGCHMTSYLSINLMPDANELLNPNP